MNDKPISLVSDHLLYSHGVTRMDKQQSSVRSQEDPGPTFQCVLPQRSSLDATSDIVMSLKR